MDTLIQTLVIGVAEGLILALIALGLVLTYGLMRIMNMAHGAFLMLAAFLLASILNSPWTQSIPGFALALVVAALLPALLGLVLERTVYRRMYGRPHVSAFLAMFALMLAMQGAVQQIWGVSPLPVRAPIELAVGSVSIGGAQLPDFYVLAIGVALVGLVATGAILFGTGVGLWTRAIAADREMAAVLGCDVHRIFGLMFALGCFLAGLAGVLLAPVTQVTTDLGSVYVLQCFAVVLVGGLGSLRGALIAATGLGVIETFFAINVPELGGYGIYLAMVVVLVWRPTGLFRTANAGLGTEHV